MTTARQRRRNPDAETETSGSSGVTDYKSELWRMADALRGSMDAAEYKHVVLGLIFLKYISDAFEEAHAKLEAERDQGADPGRPRRVPLPEHLLGPARSRMAEVAIAGAPAHHRAGRGRRHDRHRAGQPGAQGRTAQGLRTSRTGQDPPGTGG